MPDKLQEFSINLPVVTVQPVADSAVNRVNDERMEVGFDEEPETVELEDIPEPSRRITVYADSIKATSFDDGPTACFDIVFSVGCSCDDGTTTTYSIVKRISIDKQRLLKQAESGQPISVVEEKKQLDKSSMSRLRRLAGLE